MWTFLLPIYVLVVWCAHILIVVRKSVKVHGTARVNDVRIHMIHHQNHDHNYDFIFISWLPSRICFFLVDVGYLKTSSSSFNVVWFSAMFLAFINICGNSFIYATQYYAVKARL